jgi:hypothetical protein
MARFGATATLAPRELNAAAGQKPIAPQRNRSPLLLQALHLDRQNCRGLM